MTQQENSQQMIEFQSILNVLKRQRRMISYSFVLVFAAAALFLALAPQKFTATALLIVDPSSGQIMDTQKVTTNSASIENARIDSEVEILRSDALMLTIVNDLSLANDPEFRPRPSLPSRLASMVGRANAAAGDQQKGNAATLARFKNALEINRRGLTHLISVTARSTDPARARDLANVVAETYIEQQVAGKVNASLVGRDALLAQINASRERLAASEDQLDIFLATQIQSIATLAPEQTVLLAKQLGEARLMATAKQGLIDDTASSLARRDWANLSVILEDTEFSDLAMERVQTANENPLVTELTRLDRLLEAKARTHLDGLVQQASTLDRRASALRLELHQNLPTQLLSSRQIAELYEIQQQATIERDQYQKLLTRLGEMETQAALQIANSRLVSPAIAPVKAAFPDPAMVLLVAIALSVGLGGTLAFLNEHFIGGVISAEQLADVVQMPVAAMLPETHVANTGRLSPSDRIIDAPLSGYSEAHRKLKAGVDHALRNKPVDIVQKKGAIVMVTSALASEGKTTAALALARTYAQAGRKTLLIDADLRRPSVHKHVGFQPESGLGDYLRDPHHSGGLRNFYARDASSDLAIILGGGHAANATDQLLTSEHFLKILDQAKDIYDLTIIDTPPVLPVVDAQYIAAHVDVAVLAAKWASTSQNDLRAAVQTLDGALAKEAQLLPVLTRSLARQTSSEYGAYYHPYSAAI